MSFQSFKTFMVSIFCQQSH